MRSIVIACLCIAQAAAPAQPVPAGAASAPASPTTLVALGEDLLPPFQFKDDKGRPAGLMIDLWRLWSVKTGVRLDIRLYPWSEALSRFRAGEGDFLMEAIATPERDQWLDFSEPYFSSRLQAFAKAGAPAYSALSDMKGLRIGAVKEDFAQIYLESHLPQDAKIETFPDLAAMLDAAIDGKVDAFIGYQYVADYFLAKRDAYGKFRPVPIPEATTLLQAAVRQGNQQLVALLDTGLSSIGPDERNAITIRWAPGTPQAIGRNAGTLAFIVAAIVALLAALAVGLHRRMAQRLKQLMIGIREREQEKERAVAEMRFNEQRLRAFTETLSGVLFILDGQGAYIDVFGSEEQLLAAPREKLMHSTVEQVLPPEASKPIMKAVQAAIQSRMLQEVEYELSVPAGRRSFIGRVSYIPESPADRPMVVFLALDATERKQLGEQLRQAQKMEAIGRLAGGVAHDFNNILTAVIGFAGMAGDDINDPQAVRQHLEEIRAGGERAVALTRQLLAFSRRQALMPVRLDLNRLVQGIEKMLMRLIGEDIQLRIELAKDLQPVLADPGQIDQVLLNLAINGRDAMPSGGMLSIKTRNLDLSDQSFGPTVSLRPGFYAVLEVSDTGSGIDAETQQHIFEPFFTTKERDKGTGLGLSTVYGIVKQSGGDIDCLSRPGQGTTFRIYLPKTWEPAPPDPETQAPSAVAGDGGTGTVLVVEDDKMVRGLICMLLRPKGYTVLEAGDATEALELFERFGNSIQLLISDVVMPGMRGPELVRRAIAKHPDLRALLISGYTDGEAVADPACPGVQFLQKPFRNEVLLAIVRQLLENTDPAAARR